MSLQKSVLKKSAGIGLAVFTTGLLVAPAYGQQGDGTALVRHAPTLNGRVEGSIHLMTAESVTLNGNAHVTGDLIVPGTPTIRLNGSSTCGGTQDGSGSATPANHTITLNGKASLGNVVRRTDAHDLSVVTAPPLPDGTRRVTLNHASQSPGNFATLRDLTLNSNIGQVAVPPGTYGSFSTNAGSDFVLGVTGSVVPTIYNFQKLTLGGNGGLSVIGPVVVTIGTGFSTNGIVGSADHPGWLRLRIAHGGLTLNGPAVVHASLEAPSGSLALNGNTRFVGDVTSDRLMVNGNSLLQLMAPVGNDPDLPFIAGFESTEGYQPGPLHGQGGWYVDGSANIVTSPVYSGYQAVSVPPAASPALLVRAFANSEPDVTFVDLYARPGSATVAPDGVIFETDATRVSLTGAGSEGTLQAWNGDGMGGGIWLPTSRGPELDAGGHAVGWLRISVRTDYPRRKWDLYFNGRMIAADLGFVNNTHAAFNGLGLRGHTTLATGFDDLFITFDNPLFADTDRDGMDDAWETAHGLNPAANDRDDDPDGDGLANIQEYVHGTDPDNSDTDGDLDNDGLPDAWEQQHFGHTGVSPTADADGDGATNVLEYATGGNPVDFYNGRAFALGTIISDGSNTVAYTYDASGRVTPAEYADGRAIQFTHSAAGNLTAVASSGIGVDPIIAWRTANNLPADGTGDGADDAILAGDGLPNLAKYAFGLDPHIAATGEHPAVRLTTVSGNSHLTLSYRRPDPAASDLTYVVQVSGDDGVTWSSGSGATVDTGTTVSSGMALVIVRDATAAGSPAIGRKIRLFIERRTRP